MRKFFIFPLFIVTVIFFNQTVKAQTNKRAHLGIGVDAGSTLKDPTRFVLGGDLRLQLPLANSFSFIATTGYYNFFKPKNTTGSSFGIVPLKAGLKYFPAKNVYIAGEAGVGFGTKSNQKNSFVYSPSVGLAFGNGLDVSLKYEDYTHASYNGYASQLALRLAYGFKL